MTLKNTGMYQQHGGESDYKEKYRILSEALEKKIASISKSNERIAARSLAVKKLIKKRSKDVELLKTRLDRYADAWRN